MNIHLPLQRTIALYARKLFLYKSNGWDFSEGRKEMFIGEYSSWKKWYLPVNVKGMIVLDVGAGEGESARFYLEQGAKKVICIEMDDKCYKRLEANAKGKPMECHHKHFDLTDLDRQYDFLKLDIEGGEADLLTLPSRLHIPLVIEVHGEQMARAFFKKGYILKNVMGNYIHFNFKGLKWINRINGWLCYAY
jgi:hypothetical protein